MIPLILIVAAVMVWFISGRSPFVWLMLAGLHLEAARMSAVAAAQLAWRHFGETYPAMLRVRKIEGYLR